MTGLLLIAALATHQSGPGALTFTQLEKLKYEAFTNLKSFRGRYEIVTLKADGTAARQDLVYSYGPKGRQMLVLVNGQPAVEQGWNDTQIWRVSYTDKSYTVSNLDHAMDFKPFEKLGAPKGQFNFLASDTGIRFGFDSDPVVEGPIHEKIDGRKTDKYVVRQLDPATNAEAVVTQWLDENTFLVRQFEIKVLVKDQLQMVVRSGLSEDDIRAVIPPDVGALPLALLRDFRRLGSS